MSAAGVQVLAPGSELGPYRIGGELGRGGMGVVLRAHDRRLGREVALKTISGLADAEAVERFVREARAAARLRHPGIVQVLDAGTIQGVSYVALELVSGGSLQKKLAKGPLPPHEAAALVRDLALAVQAAHEAGIVHRDLKPANVLLEPDGRPRLADFGLARDDRGVSLTETGVVLGTPAYMAPEQANADKGAIGPATDVYGLGAVLYHALAGSPPFQGGTGLAVMHKVLSEEVESPSRRRAGRGLAPLAPDLETICTKALEKRPGARYASAEALSQDLAHTSRAKRSRRDRPASSSARGGSRADASSGSRSSSRPWRPRSPPGSSGSDGTRPRPSRAWRPGPSASAPTPRAPSRRPGATCRRSSGRPSGCNASTPSPSARPSSGPRSRLSGAPATSTRS